MSAAGPDILRLLLEGTAAYTGPEFFASLVRQLCPALDVAGAWVTEFSADRRRLRSFAFWYRDHFIEDYEYALEGTPCEPVIDRCQLFHVRENVIELFPLDADLPGLAACSYLGMPLQDADGTVAGHLAAIDVKPLVLTETMETVFRIFGARAAAELRRLRADRMAREREREMAGLVEGAWEAILSLDEAGCIRSANRSAESKLGGRGPLTGTMFEEMLTEEPAGRWRLQMQGERPWVLADLEVRRPGGGVYPAEASVSPFERDGRRHYTVILRDLEERREAERRMAQLAAESAELRRELEEVRPPGQLTGESAPMRALFEQIRRVAPSGATVLIQGESGTGKELVARAIHEGSSRSAKSLVRVNCGAIPPALIESEFFGHERGAFTGATARREGRFSLADGGTLFLDEAGELPLDLQVKLLRVLQEGEFEPVGSSRTRKTDVRIVAATNRDLAAEVAAGRFRADLYYRLNVFPVSVPALRERGSDVELLAEAFVERLSRKSGRRLRLPGPARERLRAYAWPGNVRELENVLERAAILARGEELSLEDLVPAVTAKAAAVAEQAMPVLTAKELLELERENLRRALEACGWRVAGESGAAKLLGMAPSTLVSRMKAMQLRRSTR